MEERRMITIPCGGRPTLYTDQLAAEIVRLRAEGKKKDELAAIYGVSVGTIGRWMKRAGLTRGYKKRG